MICNVVILQYNSVGKDAAAVEEQQIEGTVDVNLGTQVEDVAGDLEKAC